MKFQNPRIHRLKVNRRTHTHTHTDRQAESNMPFQLFKVGGIKTHKLFRLSGVKHPTAKVSMETGPYFLNKIKLPLEKTNNLHRGKQRRRSAL